MTNPDNIVRVRARNGGRASVYEANAWCQMLNAGLLEGNGVLQNTSADMNVLVGGSASKPDVVIATAPSGYHVALDIVGQQAVAITAPATNSRISAVVAYTDDLSLSTTEDTVTGSPASCGLIVVNGTTSANPTNPTEATIRSAITADGATGSQAAYVVIAYITVSSATTAITNTLISIQQSGIQAQNIQPASIDNSKLAANAVDTSNIVNSAVTASKIDFTTLDFGNFSTSEVDTGMTWVDGKHIYKRVFAANFTTPAVGTRLAIDLIASNIDNVIRVCGNYSPNNSSITTGAHYAFGGGALGSNVDAEISIRTNDNKLQLLIDNYVTAYVGQTGSYSLSVEYTKVS